MTTGFLALSSGSLWCCALPADVEGEAETMCATGAQVARTAHGRNKTTTEASGSSTGKEEQAPRYLLQSDLASK